MLQLISGPAAAVDQSLRQIPLHTDRLTLAKRLWRAAAEDGKEFGFELSAPLKSEDTFWVSHEARYVVYQRPEPVVEIPLDLPPSAAAGIGWAVGNLHLDLSAEPARLLAPDEPAVRKLLERLQVPYTPTLAVFRPGRFARGNQPAPQELGPSHRH